MDTNELSSRKEPVSRREFLEAATITALMAGFPTPHAVESRNGVPYRPLGRTGEGVSMVGLGGYHIGMQHDERESIRIVRAALDGGINFLDNCWDYNNGESEVRMGKALRNGYRQKAFLMTKIDGRDKKTAASQLDESLQRLQSDHLDLLQFHEVIRMNDPDRIFAPGGGIEAALEARKAGKIRFIGFTGAQEPRHSPENARNRPAASFSLRHGADAAQPDGRTLRQFSAEGIAPIGAGENRSTRHEADRGRPHSQE